jgi:hypothetical protein
MHLGTATMNFIQVVWKYFFTSASSVEHGTMYQLRNLIGRSNVSANPIHKYNECDEFFKLVTSCHILAAALEAFQMKSLSDVPHIPGVANPANLWMETAERRKAILTSICGHIIDNFVTFNFNVKPKSTDDMVSPIL